jgi:hypothetical protein
MSTWQKPSLGLQGGDTDVYEIYMKLSTAAICDNTRFGNDSTEKEAEASLVNALAIRKAKEVIGTFLSYLTYSSLDIHVVQSSGDRKEIRSPYLIFGTP